MTESGSAGWELGKDGQPLCIPIWPRELDDVREWCREHCLGDYLIVLDRRVAFERREDAALASICGAQRTISGGTRCSPALRRNPVASQRAR